VVLAEHLDEEI